MNENERTTKSADDTVRESSRAGRRRVIFVNDAEPTDKQAAAQALMRILTNGDPVGYVKRLETSKEEV